MEKVIRQFLQRPDPPLILLLSNAAVMCVNKEQVSQQIADLCTACTQYHPGWSYDPAAEFCPTPATVASNSTLRGVVYIDFANESTVKWYNELVIAPYQVAGIGAPDRFPPCTF